VPVLVIDGELTRFDGGRGASTDGDARGESSGRAELVPQHGKAERERGLLYLHEDLATLGECGINALGLVDNAEKQRRMDAPYGLKTLQRNVPAVPVSPDVHARVSLSNLALLRPLGHNAIGERP
jgi:hypothetical protein